MTITDIDVTTYDRIEDGLTIYREAATIEGDLVVYEKGTDPVNGLVLYGFDEVGMFDGDFINPVYCMIGE
tara:strand:+ start:190 stop:399 length:210 start_codon:yes stop_codon:yes gene_type:complete